jgi:hypothetical protein
MKKLMLGVVVALGLSGPSFAAFDFNLEKIFGEDTVSGPTPALISASQIHDSRLRALRVTGQLLASCVITVTGFAASATEVTLVLPTNTVAYQVLIHPNEVSGSGYVGTSTVVGDVDRGNAVWWGGTRGVQQEPEYIRPAGATGASLYQDALTPGLPASRCTLKYWVLAAAGV